MHLGIDSEGHKHRWVGKLVDMKTSMQGGGRTSDHPHQALSFRRLSGDISALNLIKVQENVIHVITLFVITLNHSNKVILIGYVMDSVMFFTWATAVRMMKESGD